MEVKVKTVAVLYNIFVNKTMVNSCITLAKARKAIKKLSLVDTNEVRIVKQTVTEQVLDVYKIENKKVLVASDLTLQEGTYE